MEIIRSVQLPAPAGRAFPFVDDLERYPGWMSLVRDAVVTPASPSDPASDRAWIVHLQAQVGPFARSKRLRMVRTAHGPGVTVRFERSELDGRSHAAWTLQADLVEEGPESTTLTMTLAYGGNLWTGAVLQRVLDDEVRRASESLVRQMTEG